MSSKKIRFILSVFFLNIVFFSSSCDSKARIEVKVLNAQDQKPRASFAAELALKPTERTQGLMFRKKLGREKAMLFAFPEDVMNAFWMQNTLISLDIIFIDQEKKIISIVHKAEPQTSTPREPEGFYRYVLEIEGGLTESLGIKPGDRVEFALPSAAKIQ